MKKIILVFAACALLAFDTMPEIKRTPIPILEHRPTKTQELELITNKLQVINSELRVGIAEIKNE